MPMDLNYSIKLLRCHPVLPSLPLQCLKIAFEDFILNLINTEAEKVAYEAKLIRKSCSFQIKWHAITLKPFITPKWEDQNLASKIKFGESLPRRKRRQINKLSKVILGNEGRSLTTKWGNRLRPLCHRWEKLKLIQAGDNPLVQAWGGGEDHSPRSLQKII